ncbi:benzoate 4-monooxygenase cytochrome p450 [Grosmannia clavigera kw1407]|uniref:Benzoate 4-monooxygenase cytochrome p450 n=1 Tax=Grosmannia clavigera (strain kw1407 / UAMH 11150) TaxID=655863 RepID=F0XF82_GROCL|nr:benzoate 4-monooxygenase cytochrome p450 [Grosmannia clavigera kw1407]EFX04194.1 benzoate 4-monooxygenase cytochrome p450 [Grosmannia clavigera kw1407]
MDCFVDVSGLANGVASTATGGLVALLLVSWLMYRLAFASMSRLPGPWYTNLTGLVLIYHEYGGNKRLWIHGLHLRYGPVVRVAPREASFGSATAMRDIYVTGGGLAKTELYTLFEQGGKRNLFTALDKDEHKEKKKRFADRYSNTSVLRQPMLNLISERADVFVQQCTKTASADVYCYLHCYALDCVTAVCFDPHGTRSLEGGADGQMVQKLSYHDSRRTLVLQHYFPRLAALHARLSRASLKTGSRISEYAWGCMRQRDLSAITLGSRLQTYGDDELAMSEKVAECLDHIGAGIDTTGDTLCFLMHELSRPHNAARMARMTAELQAARGEHEKTDRNSSLHTLPYLDAVISEALRLWAPGTLPLPRYVPAGGCTVDGYQLPGGTVVSSQSFTLHRLHDDVFPEPDVFLPERWLAADGAAARNRHMFAFSAGPRMCIGKNVAMVEMRALLHAVYSRYRTTLADDMHYSMDMADQLLTSRPRDMCCKLAFQPLE